MTRAKQIQDHPVFAKTFNDFLHSRLSPSWEHDLHEEYRLKTWRSLCSDRAQHFAGTWSGVDRKRTLALVEKLTKQAVVLQTQCDLGLSINPDPSEDPRAQLKILRQLLIAGLMTPERDARHRKLSGDVVCICNDGCPTIDHISWHCSHFSHLRQGALEALPVPIDDLPTCFKFCTIVPNQFQISTQQVVAIQTSLIKIWQLHIQEWLESGNQNTIVRHDDKSSLGAEHPKSSADNSGTSVPTTRSEPVEHVLPKKGHILKLTADGGVFCQLCGKTTKYLKHQRLKILNKPCQFPNLPPDQWLQAPGAMANVVRLQQQWQQLKNQYNRANHHYVWNQKVGNNRKKPQELGLLWCQKCGFEPAWMHRSNNPKTMCAPLNPPPTAPRWVEQIRLDASFFQQPDGPIRNSPLEVPSSSSSKPNRRIVGKQTVHSFTHSLMFHLRIRHRVTILPQVSAEPVAQMRISAVCRGALTSHYYFWDPAGAPAPSTSASASVPGVTMHFEVSQRLHCVQHTTQTA